MAKDIHLQMRKRFPFANVKKKLQFKGTSLIKTNLRTINLQKQFQLNLPTRMTFFFPHL